MSLNLQDLLAMWGPILMLTGFMWHYFNKKFDKMDENMANLIADIKSGNEKLGSDIKRVEEKLSMDIKRVEEKLGSDIKRVEEKLSMDIKRVEEKVDAVRDRVSRIEGQLVPAKVISFEEPRPQGTHRSSHSKAAHAQ